MKKFTLWIACFLISIFLTGAGFLNVDGKKARPFYEYSGNYQDEIDQRKQKFQDAFGYELVDMGRGWSPDEIDKMHHAFSQLPPTFYSLPGMPALYRLEHLMGGPEGVPTQEVPAATFPTYTMIFQQEEGAYKVFPDNQQMRVEFYSPLFYEEPEDFINIIHHEMAHAWDVTNRILSFSDEWIRLTQFQVLNLYALDGKKDSDFLFTLLNDADVNHYAPPANRHSPTYSRQNIQEDFANSVSAYIHYPYFQFTNKKRYLFLKDKVFGGKEYFPFEADRLEYAEKILSDFEKALDKEDFGKVIRIVKEMGREYFPDVEVKMFGFLKAAVDASGLPEKYRHLGIASCYFQVPDALKLRQHLIRQNRVPLKSFMENLRCRRMARKSFEEVLASWSPTNLYFFRNQGSHFLQFLDPVMSTAHARGFHTEYIWKIYLEGNGNQVFTKGMVVLSLGGNGAVKADLKKSSSGLYPGLPEGKVLELELGVKRFHSRTFKTLFGTTTKIRFVVHPWQTYIGPASPGIRIVYPMSVHFKEFN